MSGQEETPTAGEPLHVSVEQLGDGMSLVALSGELDLSTIPKLEARLLQQVDSRPVVMDLTRLSFIDSSGIGLLIKAQRAAGEDGGELHTVIAPDSQVERVFTVAGVDRALPVFFDRADAMSAFGLARKRRRKRLS